MAQRQHKPLYRSVADAISDKVDEGELVAGDKLPSERVLCDIYEVSQITVRRALRELAYDGYVYSRHGLGWFVSEGASLQGEQAQVALLVPEMDWLATRLIASLLSELADRPVALRVLLWPQEATGDAPEGPERLLQDHDLLLALVAGPERDLVERYGPLTEVARAPAMLLVRDVPDLGLPAIVLDEAECMRRATQHLLDSGHTRLAYVGSDPSSMEGWMRYRSFADVLWSHELELPMDWVFSFPPSAEEEARLAALFRRAERPSAVVCSSDLWALQLMRIMDSQGLRCPQDVALVGMGDHEFAAQLPVALTSVRFDFQGLVEHTVSAMVAILEDRPVTNARVGGELIVRESCGAD